MSSSVTAAEKALSSYMYTYCDLLTDSFWKKLTSKRVVVRKGMYSILVAVASKCPFVFSTSKFILLYHCYYCLCPANMVFMTSFGSPG